MKYLLITLYSSIVFLQAFSQKKEVYNKWTLISLGGTEALVYNGELIQKEQIRYINIDDEVNIERIRLKISRGSGPLWLIIKAADSSVSITHVYQKEVEKQLGPAKKTSIEILNSKERDILELLKKEYPNGF